MLKDYILDVSSKENALLDVCLWLIFPRLLQLTISSDVFSNTEKVDAVDHLANTPIGRLLAWDFVVDNWDFYFEK